jgi:hypothetical protein
MKDIMRKSPLIRLLRKHDRRGVTPVFAVLKLFRNPWLFNSVRGCQRTKLDPAGWQTHAMTEDSWLEYLCLTEATSVCYHAVDGMHGAPSVPAPFLPQMASTIRSEFAICDVRHAKFPRLGFQPPVINVDQPLCWTIV